MVKKMPADHQRSERLYRITKHKTHSLLAIISSLVIIPDPMISFFHEQKMITTSEGSYMLRLCKSYSIALFLGILSFSFSMAHAADPVDVTVSQKYHALGGQRNGMEMFDALFGGRSNDPALTKLRTLQALPDVEKMINGSISALEDELKTCSPDSARYHKEKVEKLQKYLDDLKRKEAGYESDNRKYDGCNEAASSEIALCEEHIKNFEKALKEKFVNDDSYKATVKKLVAAKRTLEKNKQAHMLIDGEYKDAIKTILDTKKRLEELEREKDTYAPDSAKCEEIKKKIKMHDNVLKGIYVGLKNDFEARAGRVIARGLAGDDGKYIENDQVGTVLDGVRLGGLMRFSKSVGNTLGKRMEAGIEGTLGGLLDAIINGIGSCWSSAVNSVLYDGKEPYDIDYLKILWKESLSTLDDVSALVRNGLKDTMRTSHDMALRQAPVAQEDVPGAGAWLMLTGGYARNWQNCIDYLDEHRDYYDTVDEKKIDPVLRSIDLLRIRIVEIQKIVTEQKSLKELDSYFASIKEYIPAWRKDINQRFDSLISLITPPSSVANKNVAAPVNHREQGRRRQGDDDDEDGYGRFNRNY